jgi:hypothetical protein
MNPVYDLSFEEKVELLNKNNCIPQGKGLNFDCFKLINPENILQRTDNYSITNKVRANGTDLLKVSLFQEKIEKGQYLFSFPQPVVVRYHGEGVTEDLYLLVCGEHRLQAHKGLKLDMLCAVVDFDDLEDQMYYQSNENDEESEAYVKSARTPADVLITLSELVRLGFIKLDDDKSINAALIRLNQKTNDFPYFREELRKEHGVLNAIVSYDDQKRREWIEKNKPEISFSSRSKVVPIDGVAYVSKTFKGGSGTGGVRDLDYDPRCFFDTCAILQKESVDKVVNICTVGKTPAKKIPVVRNYKNQMMMKEWLDRCCSIVDDYRSGKIDPINDVEFKFLPQINNVDNFEEWV